MNRIRLLKSKDEIFQIVGDEDSFLAFSRKFIEGNTTSGNLSVLIEQIVSRLRQIREMISKKQRTSTVLIENTCVALHFSCLLFNYLFSTLTIQLIRQHCGLHPLWPSHSNYDGDILFKSFIEELIFAIYHQSPRFLFYHYVS